MRGAKVPVPTRRPNMIYSIFLLTGVCAVLFLLFSTTHASQHTNAANPVTPHVFKVDGDLSHIYRSLAELKKDSTLVIRGMVLSQQTVEVNQGVWTISTVSIERIVLGKLVVGNTIGVKQLGGTTSDGTHMCLTNSLCLV